MLRPEQVPWPPHVESAPGMDHERNLLNRKRSQLTAIQLHFSELPDSSKNVQPTNLHSYSLPNLGKCRRLKYLVEQPPQRQFGRIVGMGLQEFGGQEQGQVSRNASGSRDCKLEPADDRPLSTECPTAVKLELASCHRAL